MGHTLRAIIGDNHTRKKLADNWICAEVEKLPQNYAMIFLTDALFDDVTELFAEENMLDCSVLTHFTTAIFNLLCDSSFHSHLIYLETDYFGGYGSQAAVLLENGKITAGPISGIGTINQLLHKIGIQRWKGKDEFDSLGLGHYRSI